MAKFIKAARFLAEDENGFVIGEADTYEEAQAFGGRVIDTQSTEDVFQSRKNIKSSVSADELPAFSHEIAKGVLSEKISLQEAVARVMEKLNCDEKYALTCVYSWIEKEPTYNGMVMTNSRRPIKSEKAKFAVEISDWSGNVIDGDYFDDEQEATTWADSHSKNTHACLWDNENETIIKEWEIESSRRPVESTNYNNLEKELVTKILSGKLDEEKAARIIAMSKKCNLGYAKQILSTWIEERSPSLIKNGVRHVILNNAFNPDGNIDSWSIDFVPQSGMADTKAGEILRAFNQIQCSWFNHGYKVGDYKGSEYVNSAARFLKSHTDEKISKLLESATRCHDIESYDNMIQSMRTSLENYLCNNSHLFQSVNEEDMWDEFSPEDNDSGELDDVKLVNGNSFIEFKNEDGSWVCTKINVDTEYNEGDTFTLEDDIAENFEAGDGEYGDFVSEGIHYSWESLNDNEYRINGVSFEDDYFVEDSDYTSDEIIAYCADNPNWVLCNKDNDEVDMDYFN